MEKLYLIKTLRYSFKQLEWQRLEINEYMKVGDSELS